MRSTNALCPYCLFQSHLCGCHADRQYGHAGTSLPCSQPASAYPDAKSAANVRDGCWQVLAQADSPLDPANGSFSTRILLGKRDDEVLEVYARTLIELICRRSSGVSSLLLSISIREHSNDMFRAVVREIEENRLW